MLGWDDTRPQSGGLGHAFKGLAAALQDHAQLFTVLPGQAPLPIDPTEGANPLPHLPPLRIPLAVDPYFGPLIPENKVDQATAEYPPEVQSTTAVDLRHVDLSSKGLASILEALPTQYSSTIRSIVEYAKKLVQETQDKDFDIIHAHDWMTFPAAVALKEQSSKPLVLHIHATEKDRNGPSFMGWTRDIEQQSLKQADHIITPSQYTRNVVAKEYSIPHNKITAVHHAPPAIKPYKAKKPFPEKLVLFAGRAVRQKGIAHMLPIARQVRAHLPNTRFIFAGDGPLLPQLIEEAAHQNQGHYFHFTGAIPQEELYKLYAMADVFCMPSQSEPFGLAALEAAWFSTPVVLSPAVGAAEVLPQASVATKDQPAEYARAITDTISQPQRTIKRVTANLKNIQALSWDKAARQVLSVYQQTSPRHESA